MGESSWLIPYRIVDILLDTILIIGRSFPNKFCLVSDCLDDSAKMMLHKFNCSDFFQYRQIMTKNDMHSCRIINSP
jgi:hypothetical protein